MGRCSFGPARHVNTSRWDSSSFVEGAPSQGDEVPLSNLAFRLSNSVWEIVPRTRLLFRCVGATGGGVSWRCAPRSVVRRGCQSARPLRQTGVSPLIFSARKSSNRLALVAGRLRWPFSVKKPITGACPFRFDRIAHMSLISTDAPRRDEASDQLIVTTTFPLARPPST
jgi:hypothetical protein